MARCKKQDEVNNTDVNNPIIDDSVNKIIKVVDKQFELANVGLTAEEVMKMSPKKQNKFWESHKITKEQVEELKVFYKDIFKDGYAGFDLDEAGLEETFVLFFEQFGLPVAEE
jgi:hypothetical protein